MGGRSLQDKEKEYSNCTCDFARKPLKFSLDSVSDLLVDMLVVVEIIE